MENEATFHEKIGRTIEAVFRDEVIFWLLASEDRGDFQRLSIAEYAEFDFISGGALAADQIAPENGTVVWMLIVTASVDGEAGGAEKDIAFFDSGEIGRTASADGADVEAALFGGEF